MSSVSLAQVAYSVGITNNTRVNSARTLASVLGQSALPPGSSLRSLLTGAMSTIRGPSGFMSVATVTPTPEPTGPTTTTNTAAGGYPPAPAELLFSATSEGLPAQSLIDLAHTRNGNTILRNVAANYASNAKGTTSFSEGLLTAMTQLAATGANAFAKWQEAPTRDLTTELIGAGMTAQQAQSANMKIMQDFTAAQAAVRSSRAGVDAVALRSGMASPWIAVCGQEDPPDFPVNVTIMPYPQFHLTLTVDNVNLSIRYVVASSQGQNWDTPTIPPGNDLILFIHGEGSRCEEAIDLIPQIHAVGTATGRNTTVIALDLPGSGYTLRIDKAGVRELVPHSDIATVPSVPSLVDTADPGGSPLLDFVANTIVAFADALIVPSGNPVLAVVGGSLGGHMGLRIAAGHESRIQNVVAWSPASVWEYDLELIGIPAIHHYRLTTPQLINKVNQAEGTGPSVRESFFKQAFDDPAFNPADYDWQTLVGALIAAGIIPEPSLGLTLGELIQIVVKNLSTVPPQPQMWWLDGWLAKKRFITESRIDRQEQYNEWLREWHWRVAMETTEYTPATLVPSINKPLLLLVGAGDDFPMVHILKYVKQLAGALSGPGQCVVVSGTGHSIHDERPNWLAKQILAFAR